MVFGGNGEVGNDVGAGHAPIGGAGQQKPGVIIEPVENFHATAISQCPVGEI